MDRDAFEHAALKHLEAVYCMAMQLARHPDDAADLVQETYVKALGACERFEDRGRGVRPWLFRILHNVFFSEKRRQRRGPVAMNEPPVAASGEHAPGDPPPAWDLNSFDWEQVDERLKAAVDDLRPEYRSILLLWGVEGLKYREIAEIQDIPIGTVMSRLHRARAILAAQLSEMVEEIRLDER